MPYTKTLPKHLVGSTVVINPSAIRCVDEQQRSIDFVAGGCYAIGGHQECLAEGVFLFAPSNMPFATATSRRDALVSLAKVGSNAERQPPKAGENKWPAPPSPPPDTR